MFSFLGVNKIAKTLPVVTLKSTKQNGGELEVVTRQTAKPWKFPMTEISKSKVNEF